MFELTMHFKHEMIGIWQNFKETSNEVELRINRVQINHAQPVLIHSMLCQKGWKIMLCTQYRYI